MHKNTHADILILGAGIGGFEAFRTLNKLNKRYNLGKKITIVDRNNYFTFVPMLHEVAAGSIEPTHATYPLRELTNDTPHHFVKANVEHIDPEGRLVTTSMGKISYDYCVVALGSGPNYFDIPGAKEYTNTVRTMRQALKLKYDIIRELERCDEDGLHVTVVGGGYTGVEVVGQFCDLAEKEVRHLYPNKRIVISLVHAGEELVPQLPPKVRTIVKARFEKTGAHLFLGNRVSAVSENTVTLAGGTELKSHITIWATGFKNLAPKFLGATWCKNDRIPVTKHLHHLNSDRLYAAGDIALCYGSDDVPFPQLGEAAHEMGVYAARHIIADIRKTALKPFTFHTHGTIMPIGDWFGVAVIGKLVFKGRFAWWLRRTVYLIFMPGIVRKLRIVFDWTFHGFGFRHMVDPSHE